MLDVFLGSQWAAPGALAEVAWTIARMGNEHPEVRADALLEQIEASGMIGRSVVTGLVVDERDPKSRGHDECVSALAAVTSAAHAEVVIGLGQEWPGALKDLVEAAAGAVTTSTAHARE